MLLGLADMVKKNAEHLLTPEDGKLYKILDVFFDDDQKDSLCINLLTSLVASYPFKLLIHHTFSKHDRDLKDLILYKLKVNNQTFFIEINKYTSGVECLFRPKGFFSVWQDREIPSNIQDLLCNAKGPTQIRSAVVKLIKLKAFW